MAYHVTGLHKRRTSIPSAGFEPVIPAVGPPQTHALDRTVTRIGSVVVSVLSFSWRYEYMYASSVLLYYWRYLQTLLYYYVICDCVYISVLLYYWTLQQILLYFHIIEHCYRPVMCPLALVFESTVDMSVLFSYWRLLYANSAL